MLTQAFKIVSAISIDFIDEKFHDALPRQIVDVVVDDFFQRIVDLPTQQIVFIQEAFVKRLAPDICCAHDRAHGDMVEAVF